MTTATNDTTLVLKRTFKAPVAKLYRAWVDAETFCKWMGPSPDMTCEVGAFDVTPGGRYAFTITDADGSKHSARGVFRHVEENAKLVFTWTWDHMPERETLVTLEFNGDDTSSKLTLTHEHHVSAEVRDNHGRGWKGSLDKLQRLLERH